MNCTRCVTFASFVLSFSSMFLIFLRSHPQQLSSELVRAPGLADGEGAQGFHYPADQLLLLCGCKYDVKLLQGIERNWTLHVLGESCVSDNFLCAASSLMRSWCIA